MSLDLADVVTDPDLGAVSFQYARLVETVNAQGRAALEETLHDAIGNIQPAPGKERELLPDEDRIKAAILIFTPVELLAGDETIKADRVYYNGSTYRVTLAEPWAAAGSFYKALAVKE